MKEYKYISVPEVVVTKKDKVNESVNAYFDIITQESIEGWQFVQIAQISLVTKSGAFKNTTEKRNVFIFAKDAE